MCSPTLKFQHFVAPGSTASPSPPIVAITTRNGIIFNESFIEFAIVLPFVENMDITMAQVIIKLLNFDVNFKLLM